MVRSLLLTFALMFAGLWVVAQTSLNGRVMDADTPGEPLIGATVKVLRGAETVGGSVTDYDGYYRINLDPGTYNVEFSYTGYKTARVEGVQVLTNEENKLKNQELSTSAVLGEVEIIAYKVPLIKQDQTSGGQTLTSDQIRNLPTRSVNQIVATTAGTTSIDGGAINIKGSRDNATNYYVDGIRVSGNTVQVQDIDQLQVVTGGLGAEYGDVTGGVISIITKGPASEYHGAVEAETSEFLDPYGWNLLTANVSGPILRTKREGSDEYISKLGFRLSGQYRSQRDDDPPALPVHRVKESVLANLEANPIRGVVNAAEFLTQDSVDVYKYRPFENQRDINVTGKIDFRLNEAIDMSVTGTLQQTKDRFTPEGANGWSDNNWMLLNSHNNPYDYDNRYTGIFRFRHKLGRTTADTSATSRLQFFNVNYTLQGAYEKRQRTNEDFRHEDRLFEYGFIGNFDRVWDPTFGPSAVPGVPVHTGFLETVEGFTPSTTNAVLANYNKNSPLTPVFDNGFFSQIRREVWGGMHQNVGYVYNQYRKQDDDIITGTVRVNFDMKLPGGMTHNIQMGLLHEQRTNRLWRVSPIALWNLANIKANSALQGLSDVVIDSVFNNVCGCYIPIYAPNVTPATDEKFSSAVRAITNQAANEYVNVDGLNPSQLSLDMFTPFELTNTRDIIEYYGFDYRGTKLGKNVTFNDFFTARENGFRTFPVAPIEPIYQAFFIKDKFKYKDLIFSLGLRVERFDLNTKVLRDPQSLYEVISAKQFHDENPTIARPAGVGDDFKVYAIADGDKAIKGYRSGEVWYDPSGAEIAGARLHGGDAVFPVLRDGAANGDMLNSNYDPNSSFEDYKPQVNWLPRLAFSFPISEDANFFAHYDILAQRPPSNFQTTVFDYLSFYTPTRTPENNPNLRPEKVIDYEVGFQQKLNNFSAIKISTYYREMRDMIQLRTLLYVPSIGRYDTYGNIDFGTTKGFTFQYDLRRIQNFEMRLAYTLQFADGTGSDANSQRGLTSRGNIRTLSPLSFDERHNLNAILDYRFEGGNKYFGPELFGKQIFADAGINFQLVSVSGRPYTKDQTPDQFGSAGKTGSLNENRMPWRISADLRIDKSFSLTKVGKNPMNMNVYFRVSNLFDRRNVIRVYRFTGSPTDDGYLASQIGQSNLQANVIDTGRSELAFRSSYAWAMLDPDNFTQPRRMYLGATFEF